jgi:hypothetical protein
MSEIITCPHCQRKLNLQEDYLGQAVQCPACGGQFTAELTPPSPPPPRPAPARPVEEPQREYDRPAGSRDYYEPPRRRRHYDDDYDDYDRRYRRPHRGAVILTLGILGLALFWIPLAGWVMGGIALGMGNSDEVEMARGVMDRSGKGQTQAGKICGLIAVILSTLTFVSCCVLNAGSRIRL